MHWNWLFLGSILLLTIVDFDMATKHHRDRGNHRREQESLLDKQEREREEKDRKKKDEDKKEATRNITCYKCDGDLCRDPFQGADAVISTQCEYSCWKGVFAATVRRGCGNKRCGFAFNGNAAISNTCCQTSLCNQISMRIPSMMILIYSFILVLMMTISIAD